LGALASSLLNMDYILQRQQQEQQQQKLQHSNSSSNSDYETGGETGSLENHRPYIPKYSIKDESLLRRVNLTSMEQVNVVFFPDEHHKGKEHWVSVPKHFLGIDTDFSFVTKKVDEYRKLSPEDRQRELVQWDKMQRWERNMYEDRIAILMQQRTILLSQHNNITFGSTGNNINMIPSEVSNCITAGNVLMDRITSHKRNRDFEMVSKKPVVSSPTASVVTNLLTPTSADVFGDANQTIASYSEVPDSKRRCIRMKAPVPSRFQG
jgi:hypothetical protein